LGNMFEKLDEKTAIATVETAFERGIRLFDTSPNYGAGLAEARTAAGLRGSPRDAFILSTKVGRVLDPFGRKPEARSGAELFATGYPHVRRFDYSYDGAMRSIEQSLLRLGMDRLDIVLIHDCDRFIHGDDAPIRFREAMEGCYVALDKLRSEKVIKAIGFGLNEADSCAKFAKAGDFDAGMMAGRYSLLDQSGLSEFLPIAEAKNIAVMLAGVVNSGILATGAIPNGGSFSPCLTCNGSRSASRARRASNSCTTTKSSPLATAAIARCVYSEFTMFSRCAGLCIRPSISLTAR
jgi:D-threo-aldose 1-dehydrogenase